MAVDDEWVYWFEFGQPMQVWRVSRAGGLATIVTDTGGEEIIDLAVANGTLYWTGDEGTVTSFNVDRRVTTVLAEDEIAAFWAIVVDEHSVYWTNLDGQTVSSVSHDGSGARLLAEDVEWPVDLAVDRRSVFYVSASDSMHGIRRDAKNGGRATTIVKRRSRILRIAVHGGEVFWIERENTRCKLMRLAVPNRV